MTERASDSERARSPERPEGRRPGIPAGEARATGEEEGNIRRLLAEYCHAYDDKRADDFAALFTEDAEFRVFGQTRRGRQEIRDHIGVQQPGMPPGQHVTYNSVIEIDPAGDTARVWTDFMYLRRDGDSHTISNAGRYHDRLVREGDRWRFGTRTIVFLGDDVSPDA